MAESLETVNRLQLELLIKMDLELQMLTLFFMSLPTSQHVLQCLPLDQLLLHLPHIVSLRTPWTGQLLAVLTSVLKDLLVMVLGKFQL